MAAGAIEHHTGADDVSMNEVQRRINAAIDMGLSREINNGVELVLGHECVPLLGSGNVGLAAALRILFLGIKPPHFDEGINGWFVDQMVKDGFYRYDPTNHHGPLHFYILFLSQTLFGRNLYALRLPVVLASIGSVWLALKYDRLIPRPVARLAALAMALSPGFIFYGRYSIH